MGFICDECGRFYSWKDVEKGIAIHELVTPDSDYSTETWKCICSKCNKPKNSYVFFVSYTYSNENGNWGFGNIEIFYNGKLEDFSYKHILEITETITEKYSFKVVVVLNYKLIGENKNDK